MKLFTALTAFFTSLGGLSGNPDAPHMTPSSISRVLELFRAKLVVEAHGTLTGDAAAIVIGPETADTTDEVNADLGYIETVTRVEIFDITNHASYTYIPGVGAGKAVKSDVAGVQTLVAADAVTVSGNVVTIGTAIAVDNAALVYTIFGK